MQWLKDNFLKWLDEWKEEVESREDLDAYEKERRQLSRETLEGIHITGVHNFNRIIIFCSFMQYTLSLN